MNSFLHVDACDQWKTSNWSICFIRKEQKWKQFGPPHMHDRISSIYLLIWSIINISCTENAEENKICPNTLWAATILFSSNPILYFCLWPCWGSNSQSCAATLTGLWWIPWSLQDWALSHFSAMELQLKMTFADIFCRVMAGLYSARMIFFFPSHGQNSVVCFIIIPEKMSP